MRTVHICGIGHSSALMAAALACGRHHNINVVMVDDCCEIPKLDLEKLEIRALKDCPDLYMPKDTQERRKPNQPFYMGLPKYKRRHWK